MPGLVILAVFAVVLFGVGFAVHFFWWVAALAAVFCIVGIVVRPYARRRAAEQDAALPHDEAQHTYQ